VTATAVESELAIVNVVGSVAASAVPTVALHFVQGGSLTICTVDFVMRTGERKLGLHIVVKQPTIPGDRVVARVTCTRKIAAMRIVISMAAVTRSVSFAECLRFMAFVAFVVGVLAQQRERCQIMIEEDRVLPTDFGVTGRALAT
jgi:hypothetical protein